MNYFIVSYNDPQNFRRETPTTSHVQVQELNFFVDDFDLYFSIFIYYPTL